MERPDILLMLQEGLPDEIEAEVRTQLDRPGLRLAVIHHPGGPFAGLELYLPTAIGLFVAAGVFNGVLQEAGKDAYVAFKEVATTLWKQAARLNVTVLGTVGKSHRHVDTRSPTRLPVRFCQTSISSFSFRRR